MSLDETEPQFYVAKFFLFVFQGSNRIRRTIPSTHLLIGYWGQNGAGPSVGAANYERPLTWFCQNSKYDIINLAFLVTFFDSRNAGMCG